MTTNDRQEPTMKTRLGAWLRRHIPLEPADISPLDTRDGIERECAADETLTTITGETVNHVIAQLDKMLAGAAIPLADPEGPDTTGQHLRKTWTPPAGPDTDHVPAPRAPIDVTDTLTPGGKALARQRTENLARLGAAVAHAEPVSPERRAAADAYTSRLRERIAAEREARALGRSARRVGSDQYAIDCALELLDRRELSPDARAHLAVVVLAEYLGVDA